MKNKANPVSQTKALNPCSKLLVVLPCHKWQVFFLNWVNRRVRQNINIFFLAISILFFFPFYSEASGRKLIKVKPNESISFLCFKIYGKFSPKMPKQLSKINSHIKDWNNLPISTEIKFLTKKEMDSIIPEQKREVVVVTYLKHPVRVKKGKEGPYKSAQLNMMLDSKDYIDVKSSGRAELIMSGGRIIRLDENSTLKIGTLKKDEQKKSVTGRFKLFLGRVWGKMLKARVYRKKEMYVSTPTLVAGVRGTAYDMKLKPDQSTIIKVFEGEVEIYNPLQKMPESGIIKDFKKPHRVKGPHRVTEKEWNEILLRQYQQVIVTKEGITRPISFDYEKERQTEWIKWNEERDVRLNKSENH